MTHNNTHPDRRISIGEQQARRERDQAIAERQRFEVGRDFWKGRFERMQDERDEALDEVARLQQKLEDNEAQAERELDVAAEVEAEQPRHDGIPNVTAADIRNFWRGEVERLRQKLEETK